MHSETIETVLCRYFAEEIISDFSAVDLVSQDEEVTVDAVIDAVIPIVSAGLDQVDSSISDELHFELKHKDWAIKFAMQGKTLLVAVVALMCGVFGIEPVITLIQSIIGGC